MRIDQSVRQLIDLALREDIGRGDATTNALIDPEAMAKAIIRSKSPGRLCGGKIIKEVFKLLDSEIRLKQLRPEGAKIKKGDLVFEIEGRACSILTAERTALNFLQRLSGIATLTHQFVEKTKGTGVNICDTRKTTPGWRILEKYAVRTGGGKNHRLGLFDQILIKGNHLKLAGSISKAIKLVRSKNPKALLLEVETKNLKEVKEALKNGVDWIMLDNFPLSRTKEAIEFIRQYSRANKKKVAIEASGNVNLRNVRSLAKLGPDLISVGQLTHSAPALDFSLRIVKSR